MKKILLSPWTALITLFLIVIIRIADPSFMESVRLRYFDTLITGKDTTVSKQVHVVNIDDAYIRQKGQFPFPRNEYATFINNLYSHGAGLVVFNIYMPEPDRFGQDDQLVSLMKQVPVVLPQAATSDSFLTDKHLPFRPGVSVVGGDPASTGVIYGNIQPNIKKFNSTAAGIGVCHAQFISGRSGTKY
jgi:CHASE2 domain-containing sensor protein